MVLAHGTSDDDPYNKDKLIAHYRHHNQYVLDYFKNRPNDLCVINLSKSGDYQKFCKFLNVKCNSNDDFPWLNKNK